MNRSLCRLFFCDPCVPLRRFRVWSRLAALRISRLKKSLGQDLGCLHSLPEHFRGSFAKFPHSPSWSAKRRHIGKRKKLYMSNLQIMPLKQGFFWAEKQGHFAEKRGFHGNYFALFFVFFTFFRISSAATLCLPTTSAAPTPPKKIVPKTLP
jgi:hypothetical protein